MAFQQLLVAATHFIAEQEATYHEHLDALREMEDAPEDALWDVYLEMQTCEPPPKYSTDLERVLWYINKTNPHPSMALALPQRWELEQSSPAFVRFFREKQRVLDTTDCLAATMPAA